MKKVTLAGVLMFGATAFAFSQAAGDQGAAPQGAQGTQTQGAPQQPGAPGGQAPQGAPQQKTIADPNEYNAYMSATQQTDPKAKAAALEAFVQQYPNSVVKEEALVAAMAAYQQAGDLQKSADSAAQILQVNPNNVPAMAVQSYVKRGQCSSTAAGAQQTQCFQQLAQMCQNGLQQLANYNPPGVAAADVQKQKSTFSQIFNGACGQAALANKDFANAQKFLSASVQANPENVQDVYPLALAYVQQTPPTDEALLTGVWYFARVYNILSAQAAQNPSLQPQVQQIAQAGQYYLNKFHGKQPDSPQIWQNVVNMAKASPTPSANYFQSIPKAPSPAEQVQQMLKEANGNITQMSFGEWVLIFTYGDPQTKQTVFQQIANKPFKFQGKVIDATEDTVHVALTQDAIDANKPEVEVKLETPAKRPPTPGNPFSFQANPVSVDSSPFMMHMDHGIDLTPAARSKAAPKTKAKPKSKGR